MHKDVKTWPFLKAKIFGLGNGLDTQSQLALRYKPRPCCDICDFLQRLSISFLQRTIDHFIIVRMPRNEKRLQTDSHQFYSQWNYSKCPPSALMQAHLQTFIGSRRHSVYSVPAVSCKLISLMRWWLMLALNETEMIDCAWQFVVQIFHWVHRRCFAWLCLCLRLILRV